MSKKNKFQLSRNIPEAIKREVRQRCGFGCVICGNALYDYEHIDPEYHDATTHDPTCITLLCGTDHDRVSRGYLSKSTVKSANISPYCKKGEIAHEILDASEVWPQFILGNIIFNKVNTLIEIQGDKIFLIAPPERGSDKFLISITLSNKNGKEILRIEKNRVFILPENWDAEYKAGSIILKNNMKKIILNMEIKPPNKFYIKELHIKHKEAIIDVTSKGQFEITYNMNGKKAGIVADSAMEFEDVHTPFFIGENG